MIKYSLVCGNSHEFEAWFSSSSDYDDQAKKKLVSCPYCGVTKVEKALMAPNIATGRGQEAMAKKKQQAVAMLSAAADDFRQKIADNCDYVGSNFPEEARAIHYGEKPDRAIYGEATPKEASDLSEEGVGIAPLPDIAVPKAKDKLN